VIVHDQVAVHESLALLKEAKNLTLVEDCSPILLQLWLEQNSWIEFVEVIDGRYSRPSTVCHDFTGQKAIFVVFFSLFSRLRVVA